MSKKLTLSAPIREGDSGSDTSELGAFTDLASKLVRVSKDEVDAKRRKTDR